jgi:hypothetical protein
MRCSLTQLAGEGHSPLFTAFTSLASINHSETANPLLGQFFTGVCDGGRHTAMPNTSGKDRRVVIMGYAASATRWASPHGPLFSERHAAELEASGRMTETLRSLTAAAFKG